MRIPPEPHYSFTIPSIHDDTTLDCRIYLPDVFGESIEGHLEKQSWRKRGIVMAHPYAPMGGSYDDRVVSIVVDELLTAGYIVGTFNFRYFRKTSCCFKSTDVRQRCSWFQAQRPYQLVWQT
jgi:alpha/beta superfamily hydrolase